MDEEKNLHADTPVHHPKRKKLDQSSLIRLVVFVAFVGLALFALNRFAPKASLIGKRVTIDIVQTTETEAQIVLDASRAAGVQIVGLQLVGDIIVPEGTQVSYTQGAIEGVTPVIGEISDVDGGKKISIAHLAAPQSPFTLEAKQYTIGTLSKTAGSGEVTIRFSPDLAKVLVFGDNTNLLSSPGDKMF